MHYICRVEKGQGKNTVPLTWPQDHVLKSHRSLTLPQSQTTEFYQSLYSESHQSLSLPQNQATKSTNTKPSWKAPPPSSKKSYIDLYPVQFAVFLTQGSHHPKFFLLNKYLEYGLLCGVTFSLELSPAVTTFSRATVELSRAELQHFCWWNFILVEQSWYIPGDHSWAEL